MTVHGFTIRFCYYCKKTTSHAIVETNDQHVKAYVCQDLDHQQSCQAQAQGAD